MYKQLLLTLVGILTSILSLSQVSDTQLSHLRSRLDSLFEKHLLALNGHKLIRFFLKFGPKINGLPS